MEKKTQGKVIGAARQWWLKINRKPVRGHALDGAEFPYIIKIRYTVGEKEYTKRKWIPAGKEVPQLGSRVTVVYKEKNSKKAKVQ